MGVPNKNSFSAFQTHWLGSAGGKTTVSHAQVSSRSFQGGSNPTPTETACPPLHPGAGLRYPKGGTQRKLL